MTDKLRKYVLPNIPYVFIGWVFLKLGTAYRLAAGGDFAHKFIGLGQTVGAAFADFAPGLAPLPSAPWTLGHSPSRPTTPRMRSSTTISVSRLKMGLFWRGDI